MEILFKNACAFLSQVPNPQRLVPRRWYECERPVLGEDQVPHYTFMAMEIKHGITYKKRKDKHFKKRGYAADGTENGSPHQQNSHLLTHSRFWSPRSPSLWPEEGCWSLLVPFSMSELLRQILEVWARRPDPTLDDRSWSSYRLDRSLHSELLCNEAWRCHKEKT